MGSDSVAHEGERNNTRIERVRLLRRALPMSLLIFKKKRLFCSLFLYKPCVVSSEVVKVVGI